jgi:RDD family
MTHAGVVTRLLAACVDLAGVLVATLVLDLGAAGVRFAWSPVRFRWPQPGALVSTLAVVVIAVAYLTVAWAVTGRTQGGRLLGLRLVSTRLAPIGWLRSFLRAATCVVFPIGLLWSAVSTSRRSIQDVVFRTLVVYDAPVYAAAPAPRVAGRP